MTEPSDGFIAKHTKLSRNMERIAKATNAAIKRIMGAAEAGQISFSMFVWHNDPPSGGGWASYIGTCEREDMIPVIEAMLERWKRGEPDPPLHTRH